MKQRPFTDPAGRETLFDWPKIYAIILKNWQVLRSDKVRLVPMMIFPIIMIVVFGFASTGTPHNLPAVLVDYDQSPASASFTTALRSITAMSIRFEVGTEGEARKLLDHGEAKAMLIIPSGFGRSLETGSDQAQFIVKVDESDSTVSQILRGLLSQTSAAFSHQYALARLQAIGVRDSASAKSLDDHAASLESLSAALSQEFSGDDDFVALNSLSAVMQADLAAAKASLLSLQVQVGVVQNADNFNSVNTTGIPNSIQSASSTDYDLQVRAAQARIARDQTALAQIARLKAASAIRAANPAPASLALAAASLRAAAVPLRHTLSADVLLTPVVYLEKPAYGEGRKNIDFLLPAIIALVIFQGAVQGMGRALAGEKKDGSLTRVFLTPTSNATILTGTMLFYMIFESLRSSFVVFVAMVLFGVTLKGSILLTLGVIMLYSLGCTALGLLLSAVTNSQEQYISVSMLVSLPAIFLSGVFFPVQTMPTFLQSISGLLPLSYAATALRGVMIKGFDVFTILPQIFILAIFSAVFTAMALLVFKREIA